MNLQSVTCTSQCKGCKQFAIILQRYIYIYVRSQKHMTYKEKKITAQRDSEGI